MSLADVFKADGFSALSLTASINKLPYQPGRLGQLGVFENEFVDTTVVAIEEEDGIIQLIPDARRGGPGTPSRPSKRKIRNFTLPQLILERQIKASDVDNVRLMGSENQVEGVARKVTMELQKMLNSHQVTLEHLRIGAVKGVIYDYDGSTEIYNLFTEFGITEKSVDFVLSNASTNVRGKALEVVRHIEKNLGARPYQRIVALAGETWFDSFINHTQVKTAYERWQDGEFLRSDPRSGFNLFGIQWEEYRGKIGTVDFIPTNQVRFFPVGAPEVFKQHFGPADFVEAAGTIGQQFYAKQAIDSRFQRFVDIHTQSNPLPLCTMPEVLVKGTTS